MKTGRSLMDLAREIERQKMTRKDYLAPTEKLSMRLNQTSGVALAGLNGEPLTLTPFAHGQLADDLQIPKRYYDRMLAEAPGLLADNVNEWLDHAPQRRLVRTLDGRVRAWLSDRYRPLDHVDLLEAILPAVADLQAGVASCEVTDTKLYVKLILPSLTMDLAMAKREAMIRAGIELHTETPPPDVVQAAVTISNSEVGAGALSVDESLHRLTCYNLMTVTKAVRKYHVGKRHGQGDGFDDSIAELLSSETRKADDRAFFLKVRDVVKGALSEARFTANARKLASSAGEKIVGPVEEVLDRVVEVYGLQDGTRSSILKHIIEGGDLSRYGLIQAVTRASQDEPDYDLASGLERLGGEILELDRSEWTKLAA